MACDKGCCGDKDVKPCPVCGESLPAAPRVKTRKYCSSRCRERGKIRKGRNGPKPSSTPCIVCGSPIQQDPHLKNIRRICSKACRFVRKRQLRGGKPEAVPCTVCGGAVQQDLHSRGLRKICSRECRRRKEQLRKKDIEQRCESCDSTFFCPYKKRFCSNRCRSGGRGAVWGDPRPCERCGVPFKGKKGQRFCSRPCSKSAPKYCCLCCGVEFKKKRYKSGAYSCQTKYCSRECAFEARRRKLPAAQRPLEVAGRLAGWFLSWGDDVWPVITRCRDCGCQLRTARHGERVRTVCQACSAPPRKCVKCWCAASKYSPYCEQCAERSKSEAKKRARKKRRWHQNVRKRCRRYGAPYAPVSRKKILDRDKWKCQICGVKLLPKYTKMLGTNSPHPRCPTVDHIIPICLGKASPGHVESNLQAACWECNCLKSDKPLHSFVPQYTTSLD